MSIFTRLLTCFSCVLALAPATLAQTEACNFTFFYYGQPASMTPAGVNNSDTLIGTYFDAEYRARGFIRFRGGRVKSYRIANLPDSQYVFLTGINDKGQIVGYVSVQKESGFLLTRGKVAAIVFPHAYWTAPSSINNAGTVVGTYLKVNESERGFLHERGRFTSLYVPESLGTAPSGINDAGVIVGTFADRQSVRHGFVRIDNHYITLDFPGASWTTLAGINERGEIVGNYVIPPGPALGFVYKGGQFKTLDVPNMPSAQAFAINERGDLAGLAFTADYSEKGFLGTECR